MATTAYQRNLLNATGYRLQAKILEEFNRRVLAGTKGVTNGIVAATKAWGENMGNPADMLQLHQEVARVVVDQVLEEYDRTVTARKKVASYRVGQNRFSGGALRRALSSPTMALADATGIAYVDQDLLNQEARHWQRLNFGAGGGGGPTPGRYPFKFNERLVFTLQFRAKPRPAFHMPIGMFIGPGGERVGRQEGRRGMDKFQPISRKMLPNPTRGIEARQFLDKGLEVMAELLPARYEQQMVEWKNAGDAAGQRYFDSLQKVGPRGPHAP